MRKLLAPRWIALFLCSGLTCWFASVSARDLSAVFKQQKPKPTEEEEETSKPKKPEKPAKKPATEEEEESPAKPKPQTPTVKPVDAPVNLAEEAKKAEHEQIRKLFEELAQPFDRI